MIKNVFVYLLSYKKTKFVHFICLHYLKNKENVFSPKKENIEPYFHGHNTKSFVTFYNEDQILMDLKKINSV